MAQAALDLSQPFGVKADRRLREDLMIWISSVRPDGRPHTVPVWFLWDGATLLIFSKPDQKVRNLQHDPRVMLGLDNTKDGSDVILIEGEATLLPPGEIDTTFPPYAAKYAGRFQRLNWSAENMATTYTQAIRITPTRFIGH